MIPNDSTSGVDRDNPWPGLASFTEDLKEFFFGREQETDELLRLVGRETLTVLFGQSGLGKTSLLQAGLFPRLRAADYVPIYVRLDYDPRAFGLPFQVQVAIAQAIVDGKLDAPTWELGQTLWEYFHRKDADFWTPLNRPAIPVLVFDQFEEIFTLGRATDAARARGHWSLENLAELVENRIPAHLRDADESDPAARFQFARANCKVIISLREDFLPELEELRPLIRSVMQNRMRITRMSGAQALEVVEKPGAALIDAGVAARIVRFVAAARADGEERPIEELEVEPALLSVVCRELNAKRQAGKQSTISADLVAGNRREILADFYERSVADLPPGARMFVEDRLLTRSGYRDNVALENALADGGLDRRTIDLLVTRRLLRLEDRLGVQRVELTHDVLAEPIRASRDARQERQAREAAAERDRQAAAALRSAQWRRVFRLAVAAGIMFVLSLAGVTAYALQQRRTADLARGLAEAQSKQLQVANAELNQANEKVKVVADFALGRVTSPVPAQADAFTNTLGMKFVRIFPGSFIMGSPASEPGRYEDELQHRVLFMRGFLMGTTHVTRGQFAAFAKEAAYKTDAEKEGFAYAWNGKELAKVAGASWRSPGFEQTDDHPVVEVSWNDAVAFCQWLSKKENKSNRLPTETEWEYACRAGTTTAYFWGDSPDDGKGFANCADLTAKEKFPDWDPVFNWHDGFAFTSPVSSFKPNPWGLYDMIGNALEWCDDAYAGYPSGAVIDVQGSLQHSDSTSRVLRGGSWNGDPRFCRAAYRSWISPGDRGFNVGFRLALDVP